jgi:hypothetical protein
MGEPLVEVDGREFEKVQATHLHFLEEWGSTMPKVAGASPVQALSYELVQIFNQIYLQKVIANASNIGAS